MERVILHCDCNAYFASVECIDRPELRHVPMAVCGNPESRHGIILAKNELAKKYGIQTAETLWQAKKKCPSLTLVPPHHDRYQYYCRLINQIYGQYTDQVEAFSIDESWLDVTASLQLFGSGEEIADQIRERVKRELGLTLSVGVSYNKIFAKMGSEYKKPDATTVISRKNYRELLWPMDVGEMFFVGAATAEKLRGMGIATIGDLARANPLALEALLGKHGPMLCTYANGQDNAPVAHYGEREPVKSVGNGITFKRNLCGPDDVRTAVTALADTVATRLREQRLKAWGIKVDIKDPSFHTISRQKQLARPTHSTFDVRDAALELIRASWRVNDPIRLLTITAINLTDELADEQLSLFDTPVVEREKDESLDKAMDDIRRKFGGDSIIFGQMIDSDLV